MKHKLCSNQPQNKKDIFKYVNKILFKNMECSFARQNEVASLFYNSNGELVDDPENLCESCKMFRDNPESVKVCINNHKKIMEKVAETGEMIKAVCAQSGASIACLPMNTSDLQLGYWQIFQLADSDLSEDIFFSNTGKRGIPHETATVVYKKRISFPGSWFEACIYNLKDLVSVILDLMERQTEAEQPNNLQPIQVPGNILTSAAYEKLLLDIHHNVKNSFQNITSIFKLQKDTVDHPLTLRVLSINDARVRAIALIYELHTPYKKNDHIDFPRFVNRLIQVLRSLFCRTHTINIQVEVDPIQLPLYYALICASLLNELIALPLQIWSENDVDGSIAVSMKENKSNEICLKVIIDNENNISREYQELGLVELLASQLKAAVIVSCDEKTCGSTVTFSI